MKSRFLVKAYIVALLILAGNFFLVSCSQSGGPNWKIYSKDKYSDSYYDKNSIHYPITKKSNLGFTVKDKEIVNVWTRETYKDGNHDARLKQIYCAERACKGCGFVDPWAKGVEGYKKEPIEPGSESESLFNKVCFNKGEELTPTDASQMQELTNPEVHAPVAPPAPVGTEPARSE